MNTSLHDRHITPQILADLNGDNWHLADYQKRDGYAALKKIIEQKITPEAIVAELKASALRGRGGAGFPTGSEVELHAAPVPGSKIPGVQQR
jgi:NADH-quinone oxidoreductase subunit F